MVNRKKTKATRVRIVAVSEDKGTPLLGFVSNQILCDLTPARGTLTFSARTIPACEAVPLGRRRTKTGRHLAARSPSCHITGVPGPEPRGRRHPPGADDTMVSLDWTQSRPSPPAPTAGDICQECEPSLLSLPVPRPHTLEQFGHAPAEA